ncbi:MAG: HAMP domain-containing histidine kinase [Crocinitomicaceae bacterium]|nr:HAMP domain-containing histidine kinase [Crocinitomicaceae bacterium]
MNILGNGNSMGKLLDLELKISFFDQFQVQLPLFIINFDGIIKNAGSLFIFSSISNPKMRFRGQIYLDKKEELICFVGTPLINSFQDLNDKNLQLSDFAIHDSINQFLFTLQMHISSLDNAQDLANKFKLSNIELKETNDSLDGLIYKLTHDLRAPAINIKSMLIMLDQFVEFSNIKAKKVYNNSLTATQTLLDTIEDFLELSRLEKFEKRTFSVCNINEIIDEIKNENSMLLESNNVEIILNLSGLNTVTGICGDIKSIFQNLVTNSIKYRAKERSPRIILTASKKGKFVKYTFSDNGIGIDLETQRSKLFEMFSRVHSDSTISGTGIGLYLVKKLIIRNNGLVEVTDSKVDVGTTFTIHLPCNHLTP